MSNELKWYRFTQNNSGGGFDVDGKVCHQLFIQAPDEATATEKAVSLGVYFNGCDDGTDCPCCGDRWYGCDEVKLPVQWRSEFTLDTIEAYAQLLADRYGWTKPDVRIFYADGNVVEIFTQTGKNNE